MPLAMSNRSSPALAGKNGRPLICTRALKLPVAGRDKRCQRGKGCDAVTASGGRLITPLAPAEGERIEAGCRLSPAPSNVRGCPTVLEVFWFLVVFLRAKRPIVATTRKPYFFAGCRVTGLAKASLASGGLASRSFVAPQETHSIHCVSPSMTRWILSICPHSGQVAPAINWRFMVAPYPSVRAALEPLLR